MSKKYIYIVSNGFELKAFKSRSKVSNYAGIKYDTIHYHFSRKKKTKFTTKGITVHLVDLV